MAGSILGDKRYPEFVARYHADPLRFLVEVCGMVPSEDQIALANAMAPRNAKVSVVSGTGCFAPGTMVMRADGTSVAVEDVRVGDKLMGADGMTPRDVLELRRGRERMYKFTYSDGRSHTVNESHRLCLAAGAKYLSRGKEPFTTAIVKDWLAWPKTNRNRYYAYRNPVVAFDRAAPYLPVPPYVLGIWLGDGTVGRPAITCPDSPVIDAWVNFIRDCGALLRMSVNSTSSDGVECMSVFASRVNGTEKHNPVTAALEAAGVLNRRHIPEAYKYSSLEDRLELLAGLIDTDGHFDSKSGGYDFIQKSQELANDVAWLARSVGCHAEVKECRKRCVNTGAWGTYYRLHIGRMADIIPVRVERKKHDGRLSKHRNLRFAIRNVEDLGEGDYCGFVLDGDGLFLGADFTVLSNTGKTMAFGRLALWHMLCHPFSERQEFDEGGSPIVGSNTYIGAPRIQQVADGIWKEMTDAKIGMLNGPHAWVVQYFRINKTSVTMTGHEDQWFITQIALQSGQSVGVAGKHRYWQLVIIDEAAGVPDEHYNVINGTQTQGGNRTLLASQGVKNTGFFYDTHNSLSRRNGGSWTALRFNSERSPFVTTEWLRNRLLECGGRNTVEYKVRVLGLFAEDTSNVLLSRDEIESALMPRSIIGAEEPFGIMLLADIGLGEYRDDSVLIVAKVIGDSDYGEGARRAEIVEIPYCTNSRNEIDFAGDIVSVYGRTSNPTLYVDNGGNGATVNKLIERSGVPVNRVNWGKPCFKREYQDRFYNLRACAMVRFRDAVRQGRVSFPNGVSQELRNKIIDQGSRLPFMHVEAGGLRYKMMSKPDMRKEGIKSPDIIDAISFIFLEGATYVPAENYQSLTSRERVDGALERAAAALAQINV